MSEVDWTDEENDLIVEDYFDMLVADLAKLPYVKAQHRRTLLKKLKNIRSEGSIEFKHQNISAVMLGLGNHELMAISLHLSFRCLWLMQFCERSEKVKTGQNLLR